MKQDDRTRLALLAASMMAVVLLLGLAWQAGTVQAQQTGRLEMSIEGPGVECSASQCIVEQGSSFNLIVSVTESPVEGYIGVETQVVYKSLIHTPTNLPQDEMLITVDGFPGIPVRAPNAAGGQTSVGMTAGLPPFTTSHYEGPAFELAMTCTDSYSRNDVEMRPFTLDNTLGAGFKLPDSADGLTVPSSDTLLIHCGDPPANGGPEPGETAGPNGGSPGASADPPRGPTATELARATGTAAAAATATAEALDDGAGDDDDDGSAVLWIVVGVIAAVAVVGGTGGYLWWRQRQAGATGSPGSGEAG